MNSTYKDEIHSVLDDILNLIDQGKTNVFSYARVIPIVELRIARIKSLLDLIHKDDEKFRKNMSFETPIPESLKE